MHRANVEVEGKIPGFVVAFENGAVVDKTGAVDEQVYLLEMLELMRLSKRAARLGFLWSVLSVEADVSRLLFDMLRGNGDMSSAPLLVGGRVAEPGAGGGQEPVAEGGGRPGEDLDMDLRRPKVRQPSMERRKPMKSRCSGEVGVLWSEETDDDRAEGWKDERRCETLELARWWEMAIGLE